MVSKEHRLPYRSFYLPGYTILKTEFFTFKSRKNDKKENRIGVVIAKSAEKDAVKRNFWKRQAKSFLSSMPHGSNDFVLIFTSGIKKATRKSFRKECERASQTLFKNK